MAHAIRMPIALLNAVRLIKAVAEVKRSGVVFNELDQGGICTVLNRLRRTLGEEMIRTDCDGNVYA